MEWSGLHYCIYKVVNGITNRLEKNTKIQARHLSTQNKEIEDIQTELDEEFENTKSLVYVPCSRAIIKLRILYLDDISEINNGIKSVFGNIEEW